MIYAPAGWRAGPFTASSDTEPTRPCRALPSGTSSQWSSKSRSLTRSRKHSVMVRTGGFSVDKFGGEDGRGRDKGRSRGRGECCVLSCPVGLLDGALERFQPSCCMPRTTRHGNRSNSKKLSGRWSTARENKKAKAERTARRASISLFTEDALTVELFHSRMKLDRTRTTNLKSSASGERTEPESGRARGSASAATFKQAGRGLFTDFEGEKLILVGRINWRPWLGFALSGEYTARGEAGAAAEVNSDVVPEAARPNYSAGPLPVVRAELYVDANNAGTEDGSAAHPFKTVQQAIDAAKAGGVPSRVAGGGLSTEHQSAGKSGPALRRVFPRL